MKTELSHFVIQISRYKSSHHNDTDVIHTEDSDFGVK